jgi:hypothetical protein
VRLQNDREIGKDSEGGDFFLFEDTPPGICLEVLRKTIKNSNRKASPER